MIIYQKLAKSYFHFNENLFERQKLNEAFQYLDCFIKGQPSRLFDDTDGYCALIFIAKSLDFFKDSIQHDLFVSNDFEDFFSILLAHFYHYRYHIDFAHIIDIVNAEHVTDRKEIQMQVFTNLLFITNQLLNMSKKMRVHFVNKGLDTCLLWLKDQTFMENTRSCKIFDFGDPNLIADYLTMIVGRNY